MVEEILSIDWDQVRFKRALSGLVAILVVSMFISVVEAFVLISVIATLFNIAAANDGSMRHRWRAMTQFSVLGALIGGLAFWSIDSALGSAAVLGVVTFIGTLVAAFGQRQARASLFLTLWAVLAMTLGTADIEPLVVSSAFIVGGLIAAAITAARLALTSEDEADDDTGGEVDPDDVTPEGSTLQRLMWAARGETGEFAAIRAGAVVVATLVGFWLFPGFEFWGPITVIIVVRPSTSQTASIAVQRTVGTAIGAIVAVMAVQAFPGNQVYALVGFAVSAFFMVAFMNANYTLFAAFLTSTLVFALRMAQADAFDGGIERVLATLLGALIGLVTVVLVARFHDHFSRRDPDVTPS